MKVKQITSKLGDGTFGSTKDLGADASNVDMNNTAYGATAEAAIVALGTGKADISGANFTGKSTATPNGNSAQLRNIQIGNVDITDGVTELASGSIYIYYKE